MGKVYKGDQPVQRPPAYQIQHSNRYEVGAVVWIFGFMVIVAGLVAILVLNYPG